MIDLPGSQPVVRFAGEIDSQARGGLLAGLELVDLTARVGFDLGERTPRSTVIPLRAVISLLGDAATAAQKIAETVSTARDWLVDRVDDGFVEVEIERTGAAVRVRARDPQTAGEMLARVLPGLSGDSPLGWDGTHWSPESDDEECEDEPRPTAVSNLRSRKPRVLLLDTDWFSAKGGISTFNRMLGAALVRADAEVMCMVLDPSEAERKHADAVGVTLVAASKVPLGARDREGLLRRPQLAPGKEPDIVIGHGHITGEHARILCEDHFRSAVRGHVVHTWSDHIEWHRTGNPDAGRIAERRWTDDIDLARTANAAFAVGPLLQSQLEKALSRPGDPKPVRVDPGFDLDHTGVRTPPTYHERTVLLMGRLDDWSVKGLDLAAQIVGAATAVLRPALDVEILLRGVPEEQHDEIRRKVLSWAGVPDLQVTTRGFSISADDLLDDLRRSAVVLMPARAEGFGLVGREAIVAGTPLLVAARSGLGILLRERLPVIADQIVLPVGNTEADLRRWTIHTAGMLRDPAGAFATAEKIRRSMAEQVTSAAAAQAVLGAFGY